MNYSKYYPIDVMNGTGTRCTLFVSGCSHMCKGCYNQSTWSPDAGEVFTQELEDQIITDLLDTRVPRAGLSLSGGDPLHPSNVSAILKLVKRVKKECPTKDIWLWSGYKVDNLTEIQQEILTYIDVFIDGKYIQELHSPSLKWVGSSNQLIHTWANIK